MTPFRNREAKSVLALAVVWTRTRSTGLLSPAEVWNLALLSNCNLESYGDLAAIRGISKRTVSEQLRSARLKLGARTNTFAVAEAIRRQLIPCWDPGEPGQTRADVLALPLGRQGSVLGD